MVGGERRETFFLNFFSGLSAGDPRPPRHVMVKFLCFFCVEFFCVFCLFFLCFAFLNRVTDKSLNKNHVVCIAVP